MSWLWRRFPRVRQHDQSDCGAACLDAIARHHGLRVPLTRIRRLASTDETGTNVLGMVEAAQRLGFVAKGVKAPPEALTTLPKPFIAHLVLPSGLQHYVAVATAAAGYVKVMDPADGELRKVKLDAFSRSWTGVLILLAPGGSFTAGNHTRGATSRFITLLRPHRGLLLQALLGAAIYTILGLATAVYVQKIVDHVLVGGNQNLLNLLSVAMLLILGAQIYIGTARSLITLRTGQHIDAALIMGYYRHLLALPQRFFDTMRTGELISRVGDAVKIRGFINDVAVDLLVSAMIVVLSAGVMLTYNVKLGLLVIAVIPLFALVFWTANGVHRQVLRKLMENAAELESHLVESLGAITTIKRFDLQPSAAARGESAFVRLLGSVYTSSKVGIYSGAASEALSRLAIVLALWVGAGLVIGGELTPGELMSFYALIGYFTGPATKLVGANRSIQDALIATDRLFEIMDLEVDGSGGAIIPPEDSQRSLTFENVTFRYGAGAAVLREVDLRIEAGSITAIVGESGCGKSTLVALVHNLYTPSSGRVCVHGYDIRMLDQPWLRRHVAVVPQTISLFTGSIVDNIAPGSERPDMLRLLRICDDLGISDFVEELPAGFQTQVGENGVRLSGGQRQRICIARALYLGPDVLILDEATSSLDAISEAFVKHTLTRLRSAGRAVVVIGHRLASIADADRIVVMEDGRITAAGTHVELVGEVGGLYRRLWEAQNPAYVGDVSAAAEAELVLT